MKAVHPLEDIHFQVFTSIADCRVLWEEVAPEDNLFLQYDYLSIVEKYPPVGITFRYAIVFRGGTAVGLVYTQIVYFNGAESIRYHRQMESPRCFFQTFGQNLKGLVARQVGFNTLVCGNLMLSGEHGFAFKDPSLNTPFVVESVLHAIRAHLDNSGTTISVSLLKDFHKQPERLRSGLQKKGYHDFHILPSMVMPLEPTWTSYSDYLQALSSKYRVRANKAKKLLDASVQRKILSLDEIRAAKDKIFDLYRQVVDDSGFNVITIHPDYFPALAEGLGDRIRITGYYLGSELIGFMSAILNTNGDLEAHFLGYDNKQNPPYKLYFNMLLDLVAEGIRSKANTIIFSRTAEEIKSSVGAIPIELVCFIKHRSNFSNRFIKPLLDYLTPSEEIVLRHPFRMPDPLITSVEALHIHNGIS